MKAKFKVGDKVVCYKISAGYGVDPKVGEEYTISRASHNHNNGMWIDVECKETRWGHLSFFEEDFKLSPNSVNPEAFKKPEANLNMYTPIYKTTYNCPYEEYNDRYNLEEP